MDGLCLGYMGAVSRDDWVEVTEAAVGVTEWEAEKTGVKDVLEESRDNELGERHFAVARDVLKYLAAVVVVLERGRRAGRRLRFGRKR